MERTINIWTARFNGIGYRKVFRGNSIFQPFDVAQGPEALEGLGLLRIAPAPKGQQKTWDPHVGNRPDWGASSG